MAVPQQLKQEHNEETFCLGCIASRTIVLALLSWIVLKNVLEVLCESEFLAHS